MKVKGNTRGRKQRVPRGRGRGKRTDFQSTDLVVTVSNEDNSSSRLKPPVTASQPRKIVLNRKTESTDLEKVTVKSLDEIKREKEQRQLGGSAHETTSHDSVQAGGSAKDSGEDRNLFDTFSKPAKVDPSCRGEPVAATRSGSGSEVSSTSGVTSRPELKKLSIPLKALSALAPHHKILPGKQPINAAIPRWVSKQLLKTVIQSGCGSGFCYKLQNQIASLQWKIIIIVGVFAEKLFKYFYGMFTYKFYSQGHEEGNDQEFGTFVRLFCHSNLMFCSNKDKINI